uniref:Crinkler (CRN) family protein n=1 Tax=Angiostrongylus cantonensis TaxID=6313 RepID=A0A0K0D893_ANGCA
MKLNFCFTTITGKGLRINTTSNQVITSDDLTTFGDGLREAYGLDAGLCRNYILILGVELAKEIYVWVCCMFPSIHSDCRVCKVCVIFCRIFFRSYVNWRVNALKTWERPSTATSYNFICFSSSSLTLIL